MQFQSQEKDVQGFNSHSGINFETIGACSSLQWPLTQLLQNKITFLTSIFTFVRVKTDIEKNRCGEVVQGPCICYSMLRLYRVRDAYDCCDFYLPITHVNHTNIAPFPESYPHIAIVPISSQRKNPCTLPIGFA